MNVITKDTIHMNIGYEKNFCELMESNEIDGYYIYFLILDDKVIYVGQTRNIFGRIADYKCRFLKRKCHNIKLQELFDNGDIQEVMFLIKDRASTAADALRLEKDYINQHRNTCLNKYDEFFSPITRRKISVASRKMWENSKIRKNIVDGHYKKHVLTSPDGVVYEFPNSYETKSFLEKMFGHLHQNDRKRVGYQMLESYGENKGWKMVIEGKRPPSKVSRGILKTSDGEDIIINGKWELVNLNRERKWRVNVNRLMKLGSWNGFIFTPRSKKLFGENI